MDDGEDEHALLAQLIDEAPGVSGDLADVGILELGIAGSPRKWLTAGDALVSIVAFAVTFGVLYALMPNQ